MYNCGALQKDYRKSYSMECGQIQWLLKEKQKEKKQQGNDRIICCQFDGVKQIKKVVEEKEKTVQCLINHSWN